MTIFHRRFRSMAAALCVTVGLVGPAAAMAAPVTIYTDNYAADEAMSRVARNLIQDHYNTKATLKQVSVGVAFLGTARNKNTVFLAAWLPRTHGDYMKRVADQVDKLGTIYRGAKIGWVVPNYVPADQLNSITDLSKPAIQKKLDGRIQGISAGAGEMQASREAMKAYGLEHHGLRLVTASGPAMTAALKRAIDRHEWIVATGWSPHWIWKRYDLRYLKDPKGVLGSEEHVDAIANPSLKQTKPKIAAFLSRMTFSLEQINTMLAYANKTSYDAAAKRFIKRHPDVVKQWLAESS